jgi:hypothetical protein
MGVTKAGERAKEVMSSESVSRRKEPLTRRKRADSRPNAQRMMVVGVEGRREVKAPEMERWLFILGGGEEGGEIGRSMMND